MQIVLDEEDEQLIVDTLMRLSEFGDLIDGEITDAEIERMLRRMR